jgi:putative transposase
MRFTGKRPAARSNMSCCRSVATWLQRSDFSIACSPPVVKHPARLSPSSLRSYAAAKAEIPELSDVRHVCVKAAARVNNRVENSLQPTCERERRIRGFRYRKHTQAFSSSFGSIRQHFALKRHLLRASLYRKQLGERFAMWHRLTGLAQNPSAF